MTGRTVVVSDLGILDKPIRILGFNTLLDSPRAIVSAGVSVGWVRITHQRKRSVRVVGVGAAMQWHASQCDRHRATRLVGESARRNVVATRSHGIRNARAQSAGSSWNRA